MRDRLKTAVTRKTTTLAKNKAKLSIQKKSARIELDSIKRKKDGSFYKKDINRALYLKTKIELLKRKIAEHDIFYWTNIRKNEKYKQYDTFTTWTKAYQLAFKYEKQLAA